MNIDTEIGTENTDTRPTKENLMLPDTVTPIDPAGPVSGDFPVFYLRGIASFLQAADSNIHAVAQTHRDHDRPLDYRLFLVRDSIAKAGNALWPHDEQMDTFIADAQSLGHPAYIKVSERSQGEAFPALRQASYDLDAAISMVTAAPYDNGPGAHSPYHDRDLRLLAHARTCIAGARESLHRIRPFPDDNTAPF